MKVWMKMLIIILIIAGIIIAVFLYAYFLGSKGLEVREYKIEVENLPEEYHGLKIVHLSDIHYGIGVDKHKLEQIVERINLLKPDIVVFTGDMVGKEMDDKTLEEVSSVMQKIDASIGKYAIKGNHDFKLEKWDLLIENCGFKDLNDTYDIIYKNANVPILLAGISTNLYGEKNIKDKIEPIENYFNSLNDNSTLAPIYSILLIHEPDFIEKIDYEKFNLILAGHSHNGQINLPLIEKLYLPDGGRKYYKGHYQLNDCDLYISNGLGNSTFNLRLFNPPSFNLYRITKK